MKTLLFALAFAGALSAQTITVAMGNLTIPTKSAQSLATWMLNQQTRQTTLAAPQLVGDTTVTLTDATGVSAGVSLSIESEAELVTAITGNVATVTRGQLLSTAAPHASAVSVGLMQYATLNAVIKAFIAMRFQAILQQYPSSTLITQNAAIATAQAAIAAELAAAIQ